MVDSLFLLFCVMLFLAVVLGLEGMFVWWNARSGPEAKRMGQRLRAVSAVGHAAASQTIMKQRALSKSAGVEKLLLALPRIHSLDRILVQSGLSVSVADLFGLILMFAAGGGILMALLGRSVFIVVIVAFVCASLPVIYVVRARVKRLARIGTQLPDAIDLMGRAMRAGHAFPTALSMVGDEMAQPIGGEFRTLFDEVNYGVSLEYALLNLLARVPSTDLQYFVVALLLQRETGGNLAELLDNISAIIRARMKLLGEVRVLSAEGRLSAWILSLLPFAAGLMINIVNPGFLEVLWTDPVGLKMIYGALLLMAFGIWWMTRIIKIRV